MKIAIHQSHYLPWLRYWQKVAACDLFVLLDDAQFTKNDWHNRNKIKTAGGALILTVPVLHRLGQKINETVIDPTREWREKHIRSIAANYRKTPYFDRYYPFLEELYRGEYRLLGEINDRQFDYFRRELGITVPQVKSSTLNAEGAASAKLVNICRAVGADTYYTGKHAADVYLDRELFANNGIRIEEQVWTCPAYPQQFPGAGFIGDLAIIDLLFNLGPDSLDYLRTCTVSCSTHER